MEKILTSSTIPRYIISLLFSFATLSGSSQIYINEIMVNPSGTNDGSNMPNTAEWIEFYNASSSAVNIGCWFFSDGDFAVTFPSGTSIPAGGYYTVASASGTGLSPNLNWATCGCTSGPAGEVGIFTNSAEQILLYNSSGTIVDAIIWSAGQLPDGMTTSVIGVCSSQTVTFPASGVTYESIGSSSDGVSKERDYDGSNTWQNSSSSTFGTTNGVNPLPIELIGFNAVLSNNNVELKWVTVTEKNNDYFTVERSGDGLNFESLSSIKGAGNSINQITYSDTDKVPLNGTSYYRLKQTDFDGNFSYSQIVTVEINTQLVFNVYPNPTENGLITISSKETKNGSIEIINDLGQILLKEEIKTNLMEFDLSKFGTGIYMILFNSNGRSISKKVIYN